MRPREFISRVLDLNDFGPWEPDSFNSASLAISVGSGGEKDFLVHGYRFTVKAQMCLGHIVLVVEAAEDEDFIVGASICFTFREYEFAGEKPCEDHMYESWRLPDGHNDGLDRIMEVLAFLTLKTNPRIQRKVS